jgi:hypothetical protein
MVPLHFIRSGIYQVTLIIISAPVKIGVVGFHRSLRKGKSETRYERILAYTADPNNKLTSEILTRLRNLILEFYNLPQGAQIKRMLKVFATFGKEFAE